MLDRSQELSQYLDKYKNNQIPEKNYNFAKKKSNKTIFRLKILVRKVSFLRSQYLISIVVFVRLNRVPKIKYFTKLTN